jgi:hypothetical protein
VNNTRSPLPYLATSISLILLILLSLSWELWIAPLREGGSWLALKALPLCLPLTGILKKRIYTYQYSSMLILIYFAEACMRLADTAVASRICAAVSVLLCITFFLGCLAFIKQQKHTSK